MSDADERAIQLPACSECGEDVGMIDGRCGSCVGQAINREFEIGFRLFRERLKKSAKEVGKEIEKMGDRNG